MCAWTVTSWAPGAEHHATESPNVLHYNIYPWLSVGLSLIVYVGVCWRKQHEDRRTLIGKSASWSPELRPAPRNSSKSNLSSPCFPFLWPESAHHHLLVSTYSERLFVIWKIIFSAAVSWFPGCYFFLFLLQLQWSHTSSPSACITDVSFVVAGARVQKHGLQTMQNLLQEEVDQAEEHSEVTTTKPARFLCSCRGGNRQSSISLAARL